MANKLFSQKLKVVNLGLQSFADTVKSCGADVVHVNFKPPASGDEKIISALTLLSNPSVEEANKKAFEKIVSAQPVLVDILPAGKVVPGMTKDTVLHAGPPVTWDRMCGPVRGAITGALIYEGLAKDNKSAEKLAASGKIRFAPCHHHSSVGPMAEYFLILCMFL